MRGILSLKGESCKLAFFFILSVPLILLKSTSERERFSRSHIERETKEILYI